MPNYIAYGSLFIWPLLSLFIYQRTSCLTATFWAVVGGFLVLPVGTEIDLPLVPPIDKYSVGVLSAFLGMSLVKKKRFSFFPQKGIERTLVLIVVFSPIITVMTNSEPVFRGSWRPGLTYHDAVSAVVGQYFMIAPLILGLQVVRSDYDQINLLKWIVVSGLLYSLPILLEIRLSPQLHTWIYGYFPHAFDQMIRSGGFRAVVFLGHGLVIAIFVVTTLAAATLLWKIKVTPVRILPNLLIVSYLLVVLVLSKTLGALVIGLTLVGLIGFLAIRLQIVSIYFVLFIILLYPFLSSFDLFPHSSIVDWAMSVDPERAESVAFRFAHETQLLDIAQDKLLFGWGGWGRSMLDNSVPDGAWIIHLGVNGLIGLWSLFGLAFVACVKAISSMKSTKSTRDQRLIVGHALLVSFMMIDQLPNDSLNPLLFFLVGALLGRMNNMHRKTNMNLGDLERHAAT
jgi:hypothetical protein